MQIIVSVLGVVSPLTCGKVSLSLASSWGITGHRWKAV